LSAFAVLAPAMPASASRGFATPCAFHLWCKSCILFSCGDDAVREQIRVECACKTVVVGTPMDYISSACKLKFVFGITTSFFRQIITGGASFSAQR
jgi:hypothetical protein